MSTVVKMGAVVLLKNNIEIAAIIILVEDLCQPNLIKAVKEVMIWMCLSWKDVTTRAWELQEISCL